MEATAEHYHAESTYTGHPDGDEDRVYRDLDGALGRAEEQAAGLRSSASAPTPGVGQSWSSSGSEAGSTQQ